MISTQTNLAFPLSSIKPLEGLISYRQFCLETVKKAVSTGAVRRDKSPITGKPLAKVGSIEGLDYGICADTGSLFLQTLGASDIWGNVLSEVNKRRQSPGGFHSGVAGSRTENVYMPKLDWIQSSLQIHGLSKPALLEISTLPSRFTSMLKSSGTFREVVTVNEMDLVNGQQIPAQTFDAIVMLESLDRVSDPEKLIKAVSSKLSSGGVIFVTALVASGFDMTALGIQNLYFCPPDRTNCFGLEGLEQFLKNAGFKLLEVSTPGVLDVEIVQSHLMQNPTLALSSFERQLLSTSVDVKKSFQLFLQQAGLSSFARIVGRKE